MSHRSPRWRRFDLVIKVGRGKKRGKKANNTVSCIKQTIEKSIYKDCGEGKSRMFENSVLKIEFSNKFKSNMYLNSIFNLCIFNLIRIFPSPQPLKLTFQSFILREYF